LYYCHENGRVKHILKKIRNQIALKYTGFAEGNGLFVYQVSCGNYRAWGVRNISWSER